MGIGCAWALLGPGGCLDGPSPIPSYPHPGAGHSSTGSTSDPSGPHRTSASSTAAVDESGSTTSADPIDATFLIQPDLGSVLSCDFFTQDCLPGEKCMPWANDGGGSWNATKCVRIVDDPAGAGEPCHVEGWPKSGMDDCGFGSLCLALDPETLEGVCISLCVGSEDVPQCDDPNATCAGSVVPLCWPDCTPLEPGCPQGLGCYPIWGGWQCVPDISGDAGAYGDGCDYVTACDPGLVCLVPAALPPAEACEGTAGCCTEICDLTDSLGDLQCAGAAGGQLCVPWHEPGEAPPGYEHVGVCTVP